MCVGGGGGEREKSMFYQSSLELELEPRPVFLHDDRKCSLVIRTN